MIAKDCGSTSKSDPIEKKPRWLNSLYNNTLARMLTGVCRDPVSPQGIVLTQYVISYRVGTRPERRSTAGDEGARETTPAAGDDGGHIRSS